MGRALFNIGIKADGERPCIKEPSETGTRCCNFVVCFAPRRGGERDLRKIICIETLLFILLALVAEMA